MLKHGGRVAVSTLHCSAPPASVLADVEALIGCVAGAVLVDETLAMARAVGLVNIVLTPKSHYIDAMTNSEHASALSQDRVEPARRHQAKRLRHKPRRCGEKTLSLARSRAFSGSGRRGSRDASRTRSCVPSCV